MKLVGYIRFTPEECALAKKADVYLLPFQDHTCAAIETWHQELLLKLDRLRECECGHSAAHHDAGMCRGFRGNHLADRCSCMTYRQKAQMPMLAEFHDVNAVAMLLRTAISTFGVFDRCLKDLRQA